MWNLIKNNVNFNYDRMNAIVFYLKQVRSFVYVNTHCYYRERVLVLIIILKHLHKNLVVVLTHGNLVNWRERIESAWKEWLIWRFQFPARVRIAVLLSRSGWKLKCQKCAITARISWISILGIPLLVAASMFWIRTLKMACLSMKLSTSLLSLMMMIVNLTVSSIKISHSSIYY